MFLHYHGSCFVLRKINYGIIRPMVKVYEPCFFFLWRIGYHFYYQSFTINTMVKLYSVAKPLLICGYHGLGSMVFGFKVCVVVCLGSL